MDRETESCERRADLVAEIGIQRAGPLRLLAGTRDGDATAQIVDEGAIVEMGMGACDGGGTARCLRHGAHAFRGSWDSTSRAQ